MYFTHPLLPLPAYPYQEETNLRQSNRAWLNIWEVGTRLRRWTRDEPDGRCRILHKKSAISERYISA